MRRFRGFLYFFAVCFFAGFGVSDLCGFAFRFFTGSALLVEILCGSKDVVGVFLYGVNRGHDAILCTQPGSSDMDIGLLGILAGQQLDPDRTEEGAANKCRQSLE